MALTHQDRRLLAAIQDGLPLVPAPFAAIARQAGMAEQDVIDRLTAMCGEGAIRRFGVVVRHCELGYCANAMVVWDIADDRVGAVGRRLAALPYVSLCYRRPRRLPKWRYNLFTMIHGRDREVVNTQIEDAASAADVSNCPREVLFSRRCFKQRGAHQTMPSIEREAAAP